MPELVDLAPELLTLILEEVGGPELRRDVDNLLLSRKWYACARPVYLSGEPLYITGGDVVKVREFGCTLSVRKETFWRGAYERRLMLKNTRSLHMRLRGQWWDEGTKAHYEGRDDEEYDEGQDQKNVSPLGHGALENHKYEMHEWREQCNAQLSALAANLGHFQQLEDLMLQVGFDTEPAFGGKPWTYFYTSTLKSLLSNVPLIRNLKGLTLDLYAGLLNDTEPSDADAVCPIIGAILPLVPKVRLRLRTSCSSLFTLSPNIEAEDVKLKVLTLQLHMPMHYWNYEERNGPFWCHDGHERSNKHYQDMIEGARNFLRELGQLRGNGTTSPGPKVSKSKKKKFVHAAHRPSYLDPSKHGVERLRIADPGERSCCNIGVTDVIGDWTGGAPEEFFVYDDDGQDCWDEAERTDLKSAYRIDEYYARAN